MNSREQKRGLMIFAVLSMFIFCRCATAQPADPDFTQRQEVLASYLATKDALASNDLNKLHQQAAAFQKVVKVMRLKGLQMEDMSRLKRVRDSIGQGAAALQTVTSIEDSKAIVSEMGTQMWSFAEKMKFADDPLYLQYCPMEEAYWLSEEKQIFNPFSPTIMPKCGSVVKGLTEEHYVVEDCCH